MSYAFSILLKDLVILVTDRTAIKYPSGTRTTDKPRYSMLRNTVILKTGNFTVGDMIIEAMEKICCNEDHPGLFDVKYLTERWENLATVITKIFYPRMKSDLPHENVDILLGGSSPSGEYKQFVGATSSESDFKLEIQTQPGTYICLKQTPEILKKITGMIELFIEGVSGDVPLSLKKDLAKKHLPGLIRWIAKQDSYVSSCGDLIFCHDGQTEVVEF